MLCREWWRGVTNRRIKSLLLKSLPSAWKRMIRNSVKLGMARHNLWWVSKTHRIQDNLYHALSCSAENIHFLSKSYLMQMIMIWHRAKSVPGKCEKSLCVTTYFSFSDPQTRCCIVCCSHRCAWWKRVYIPGINYLKYLFSRHTTTNFSQSFVIYHLETLNGKSYVWHGISKNLE